MTLNQIEYFCTIAKYENFRQAAEILHVSQPSLSRSIATLEEELQVALFEKKGRGVALTKAGRIFLEQALNIVDSCEKAKDKMDELASGGRIDIGYVFPLAGHYIPHHARTFLSEEGNQKISFNFWQNHTPAIVKRIQNGELDIGFGGCVDKMELEYFPVLSQELIVVTPADHPLADRKEIVFKEIENYPVIGYDSDSWMGIHTKALYKEYNLHPNIIVECPDEYSILSLVRENFGIALIPETDILADMNGISRLSIKDENLAHQIYMFWMKDKDRLPAVDRFIQYMKREAGPIDRKDELKVYLKDIIHFDN